MWETKYVNKCNPGTMINTVRENDKLLWDSITVNLIRLGWVGGGCVDQVNFPQEMTSGLKENWTYSGKAKWYEKTE